MSAEHRAAVLGSPVGHSLSPAIHTAGYVAAGLTGWRYEAHEVTEPGLAGFVAGLGPEWAGLSLTMPLKHVALTVADEVTDTATLLGAANTLLLRGGVRRADNTDAPGLVDALAERGTTSAGHVAVLGAGGTARAALYAASRLGATDVTVYARRPDAVAALRDVTDRLGLVLRHADFADPAAAGAADLVVSTLPAGAGDAFARTVRWRADVTVFDVLYSPWPTGLAAAATAAGARVLGGLDLLLAQAVRQFEQFTGVPAPADAMRAALRSAAGS
ncbi:shikimate dehydrogenase [Actinocatenispora rupis]|uniref:Shikimate 5-dehydrogenase n=1 Tax=Actinocatenispora rupis TaxID=519421 RepID=A0A8J3IYR4_9ACTN|nr:shikimate dehydrogenase [Actinocatenispora rupis]GID12506.1 shikimate 5-dehydrogenase [Actinocatenispora rupis]